MGLFVTSDTDEKMDIGEGGLGLLELTHVSRMCQQAVLRKVREQAAYPMWNKSKTPSA
jgi:hypothetical protein